MPANEFWVCGSHSQPVAYPYLATFLSISSESLIRPILPVMALCSSSTSIISLLQMLNVYLELLSTLFIPKGQVGQWWWMTIINKRNSLITNISKTSKKKKTKTRKKVTICSYYWSPIDRPLTKDFVKRVKKKKRKRGLHRQD